MKRKVRLHKLFVHEEFNAFPFNLGQTSVGLFPSVFNLAESAAIIANATCGEQKTEVYCQLDNQGKSFTRFFLIKVKEYVGIGILQFVHISGQFINCRMWYPSVYNPYYYHLIPEINLRIQNDFLKS